MIMTSWVSPSSSIRYIRLFANILYKTIVRKIITIFCFQDHATFFSLSFLLFLVYAVVVVVRLLNFSLLGQLNSTTLPISRSRSYCIHKLFLLVLYVFSMCILLSFRRIVPGSCSCQVAWPWSMRSRGDHLVLQTNAPRTMGQFIDIQNANFITHR
jgi:hypothetical protein